MDQEPKSEQAGFKAGTVESSRVALDNLKQSLARLQDAGFSPGAIGSEATGVSSEVTEQPGISLGDQVSEVLAQAAAAGMSDRQIKDLLAIYLLPQTGFSPADSLARALTVAKAVGLPPYEITDRLGAFQSTLDQTSKIVGQHQSPAERLGASLRRSEAVGLPPDQSSATATGTAAVETPQARSSTPSGSTPTK